MKKMRIGTKIWLGFSCILVFLFIIAGTTIISSVRTGSNIDEVDIYVGMENSANELIHILNETRVTASGFYETHSAKAYGDLAKQIQYCDFRLKKLYEYIDAYPELSSLRSRIEGFDALYSQWREGIAALGGIYDFETEFLERDAEAFTESAEALRRINLQAHEKLSNTISHISEISARKTSDTKSFHSIALLIVLAVSGVSLVAAIALSFIIIRSIVKPISYMSDALGRIGQTGDLRISPQTQQVMNEAAQGRDETAQCTAALLVLIERLHSIDELLSHVAHGDLTVKVALQSQSDTIGLAVDKMLKNLNQEFGTIVQATTSVKQMAGQLSDGSRLLSDGSKAQAYSVEQLSGSVSQIVDKIGKNTSLAKEAAQLADNIQENANSGTEQMIKMTQAAADINSASQSIAKVIKVINDIAFQTNILALNAAVEAARAGQHGKGFSVVAQEVRNLATKSAEAAKDTGAMIENTIQKAQLGSTIAKATSESLERIVQGVEKSNALISEITGLSQEQSDNIREIISFVEQVEKIVEQNDMIASQSTMAAGEISDQTNVLHELVEQFRLLEHSFDSAQYMQGGQQS